MSEKNPSKQEAQNLAGSDAKNNPTGTRDTNGWDDAARKAYEAERARLQKGS